jgi:hypothetical protein
MNEKGKHWYQGGYRSEMPTDDGQYAYCAVGAIRFAVGGTIAPLDAPLYQASLETLAEAVPYVPENDEPDDPWEVITDWNDSETTNWDDVRQCFEAAIARAKATA